MFDQETRVSSIDYIKIAKIHQMISCIIRYRTHTRKRFFSIHGVQIRMIECLLVHIIIWSDSVLDNNRWKLHRILFEFMPSFFVSSKTHNWRNYLRDSNAPEIRKNLSSSSSADLDWIICKASIQMRRKDYVAEELQRFTSSRCYWF